jgi:ribosomal-protein-alanine N-acetyltransferase
VFPAELSTTHLRLRSPRPDDATAIFTRYASDAEVVRFLGWPQHRSVEDTRAFLAYAGVARTDGRDFVYLAFDAEGKLLGSTGLALGAPHRLVTGYVLARDAWGRGFATEMLQAMIDLALGAASIWRIEATCYRDHAASRRVMEKCGMKHEGLLRRHTLLPNLAQDPADVHIYARVRDE